MRHNSHINFKSAWLAINVPIPVPMAFHSFGGWKASLFGDHHMHGPERHSILYQVEDNHDQVADWYSGRSRIRDPDHGIALSILNNWLGTGGRADFERSPLQRSNAADLPESSCCTEWTLMGLLGRTGSKRRIGTHLHQHLRNCRRVAFPRKRSGWSPIPRGRPRGT